MKKIVYILSHIDKANEFEWVLERINLSKFSIEIISIHHQADTALAAFCTHHQVPFYAIHYQSKKDIFKAILQCYQLIKQIQPKIVHAQLFEAGLIGITAAWLAKIKHRIYTRHYSNYHHKYAPSGVKYDKWINARATNIIAITEMVASILIEQEYVAKEKITIIPHGFPFNNFINVSQQRIQQVKERHHLPINKKYIGVISRYTYWKGVQDILPAFRKIIATNSNVHLVLANAQGDYQNEIQKLLHDLPKDSYTEIKFEQDNAALFHCFDVFVHVPIDAQSEAFGQIYIEALLCNIPSIFTLSGIATEIIKNNENAIVVPYQNSEAIADAIQLLLDNSVLCNKIMQNGYRTAQDFSIEKKIKALEFLYENL